MNSCKVDGKPVALDRVFTHWTGWRKQSTRRQRYIIQVSHDFVFDSYGNYWHDVIERESDPEFDDGTELLGVDAELRDVEYPSLSDMLLYHGDLFSRYVIKHLQSEFIGFLFSGADGPRPFDDYDFFLQTLDSLIIGSDLVFIEGSTIAWDKSSNEFP